MCLLVVYVSAESLRDVVDCVLDLVEVLVDAVQPTPNLCVVVCVLPAGSFDQGGG